MDAMQWFLKEVFPQLREEFPDVTLTIVGKHMENLFSDIPGVNCTGWISDEELERLYRTSRVAVFPLRYGAGVKGKVMEAMAWGLPVVGSEVAFEGLKFRPCESPTFARPSAWVRLITQYLRAPGSFYSRSAQRTRWTQFCEERGASLLDVLKGE